MTAASEAGAAAIVLLIHHGVIDERRYTDHQLAIYTGVERRYIEAARMRLEHEGPEELRPKAPPRAENPRAKGRSGPDRDPVEVARDHAVAIRKAKPLRQLAAFFEASPDDECVDEPCEACGQPIVAGDRVRIVGCVYHEDCP